jgi:hypothetical protein
LAVYLHHTSEEGSRLLILGEWVIQEEDQLRQEQLQYYNYSPSRQRQLSRWLLGLTGSKQRQEKWGKLARQILLNPTKRHPVEADEVLRLIGSQFE